MGGGQLTPHALPASNVVAISKVHGLKRVNSAAEAFPKCVWSDSVQHLEEWPAHAVPLFVFCGRERPCPAYRSEIKFQIKDEKYVNFGLRLRCGGGDRYNGGTIGLVHDPERMEAAPGSEGQLVTITEIVVMPDSTIIVTAVGDLPFRVKRAWMPRGFRGLQCAIVDVAPAAPCLDLVLQTCQSEKVLCHFAHLLTLAAPSVAEMLMDPSQSFTVFIPSADVLDAAFGGSSDEELVGRPEIEALLKCHVVAGRFSMETLYSGRGLRSICGTPIHISFGRWPRGDPAVNDIAMENMDIMCANGVLHTIRGLLRSSPAVIRTRR